MNAMTYVGEDSVSVTRRPDQVGRLLVSIGSFEIEISDSQAGALLRMLPLFVRTQVPK